MRLVSAGVRVVAVKAKIVDFVRVGVMAVRARIVDVSRLSQG